MRTDAEDKARKRERAKRKAKAKDKARRQAKNKRRTVAPDPSEGEVWPTSYGAFREWLRKTQDSGPIPVIFNHDLMP